MIAQCDWQPRYISCDHVEAYTFELRLQKNFSVSIHKETNCVTAGEFRVEAVYQQPIDCNIADYRKRANDPTNPTSSMTKDKRAFIEETVLEKAFPQKTIKTKMRNF